MRIRRPDTDKFRPDRLLRHGPGRFWSDDHGLTGLLVVLLAALFLVGPLVGSGSLSPIVLDVFFSLTLLAGAVTVSGRRSTAMLVGVVIGFSLFCRWWSNIHPGELIEFFDTLLGLLSVALLTGFVLIQVFRAGPMTLHRVMGAVTVYLLLGVFFGEVYTMIALPDPTAFHFLHVPPASIPLETEMTYFSFSTLTTLGYGDIVPVHAFARSMSVLEALIGQLYPVLLLARLVAREMETARSNGRSRGDTP